MPQSAVPLRRQNRGGVLGARSDASALRHFQLARASFGFELSEDPSDQAAITGGGTSTPDPTTLVFFVQSRFAHEREHRHVALPLDHLSQTGTKQPNDLRSRPGGAIAARTGALSMNRCRFVVTMSSRHATPGLGIHCHLALLSALGVRRRWQLIVRSRLDRNDWQWRIDRDQHGRQ